MGCGLRTRGACFQSLAGFVRSLLLFAERRARVRFAKSKAFGSDENGWKRMGCGLRTRVRFAKSKAFGSDENGWKRMGCGLRTRGACFQSLAGFVRSLLLFAERRAQVRFAKSKAFGSDENGWKRMGCGLRTRGACFQSLAGFVRSLLLFAERRARVRFAEILFSQRWYRGGVSTCSCHYIKHARPGLAADSVEFY